MTRHRRQPVGPGTDAAPDTMLFDRIFSYADGHRYRIGTN